MATTELGPVGSRQSEFARSANGSHVQSRMLENYLSDLDYLTTSGMWSDALPMALALPHLCISLADADLRSSRERFVGWCEHWLYPTLPESLKAVPTAEELYAMSRERAGFDQLDASDGVPTEALKRLRLHRLARAASPKGRAARSTALEAFEEPVHSVCAYIKQAVNHWYREWAASDEIVQTNLARLAVLR